MALQKPVLGDWLLISCRRCTSLPFLQRPDCNSLWYPVVIIGCCSECSLLQQCFRISHLIILISVSDVAETLQFRGTWAKHPTKDLAVFHIAAKSLQVPWDWDEGGWTWLNVSGCERCPYLYILVLVQWYVEISTDDDLNSLHSGFDKLHSLECCVNRVKCSIFLVVYIVGCDIWSFGTIERFQTCRNRS